MTAKRTGLSVMRADLRDQRLRARRPRVRVDHQDRVVEHHHRGVAVDRRPRRGQGGIDAVGDLLQIEQLLGPGRDRERRAQHRAGERLSHTHHPGPPGDRDGGTVAQGGGSRTRRGGTPVESPCTAAPTAPIIPHSCRPQPLPSTRARRGRAPPRGAPYPAAPGVRRPGLHGHPHRLPDGGSAPRSRSAASCSIPCTSSPTTGSRCCRTCWRSSRTAASS